MSIRKVMFTSYMLEVTTNGGEKEARELAEILRRNGHRASVIRHDFIEEQQIPGADPTTKMERTRIDG